MAKANDTACDRTNHTNKETISIPGTPEPIAYLVVVDGKLEWVLEGSDTVTSDHGQTHLTDSQGGDSDA